MNADVEAPDYGIVEDRRDAVSSGRTIRTLLVALAACLCVYGLARGLAYRVPLRITLGSVYDMWLAAASVSTIAAVVALAASVRASARRSSSGPRLLRLSFCHAVLGAACVVLCVQPFQRLYVDMVACIWAAVWAVVVHAWPALERARPRLARRIEALLFVLCASLVGLELGLAAMARLRPSPVLAQARKGPRETLAASRFAPGRMHLGTPVNSRGYYDVELAPQEPGEKLVISIADSFGASSVPLAHHFTTVAERLLDRVTIDNMGVGGVGPPEYLEMLLFEALPRRPDLVVVCIFVGNDISFDSGPVFESDTWLRSWLDASQVYLVTVPKRIARIAREREELLRDSGGRQSGTSDVAPRTQAKTQELDLPWLADPRLEPPTFSKAAFLENQRIHARDVAGGDASVYRPFFDAMEAIVRTAGDTPLLIMLIPEEFQVEDELWDEVRAGLADLELERDRAQRSITAWLAARGVPCIDLLPRLRAVEPLEDGRRHVYLLRDTHFNVRGNKVAGEALAEWIRANLP